MIHISTSSGKNRTYRPTLTKIEPNHELRWYGKGLLPGLLNGERIFTIEAARTKSCAIDPSRNLQRSWRLPWGWPYG